MIIDLSKCLAIVGVISLCSSAEAAFVAAQTGNSANSAGFVSYAYYDNTDGGNWATELGIGAAVTGTGVDLGARHVFFYQVTRSAASPIPSTTISIPTTDASGNNVFESAGYLAGLGFSDGSAVAGATPGPLNALGPEDGTNSSGTIAGTNNGVAAPTFVAAPAGSVEPTGGGFIVADDATPAHALVASFVGLGSGGQSVVFFGTSNAVGHSTSLAVLGTTAFSSGTTTPGGVLLLPHANPEPGSLILLSFGMMSSGFVAYRRRKKRAQIETEDV